MSATRSARAVQRGPFMMYRVSHHPLVEHTRPTRTRTFNACERNVQSLSEMSRTQLEYHLQAIARASGRVRFDLSLMKVAAALEQDWLL